MHPLKSNLIFWLCGFYIVGYAALYAATGYAVSAYVLAGLLFGLGCMVLWDWGPTGIQAWRSGGREGEAILAFSLCIAATYAIYTRVWSVLRIGLSYPEWMDTSPFGQFAAVLLVMFFSGVVLATGTRNGDVPKSNIMRFAVAGFLAGCFVGSAIVLAVSGAAGNRPAVFIEKQFSPMSSNLPRLTCGPDKPQVVNAYCRRP